MITSVELRQSAFSAETEDIWLVLLTLTHATLVEPIRVVNNITRIASNGEHFEAFGVRLRVPRRCFRPATTGAPGNRQREP